ncbi:MAG: acetylxylan esterase [Acidobacteriaceae bacterium]
MVTRRTFLATNLGAAAQSALGFHLPTFSSIVQNVAEEDNIPRSHRDFWNDWPNYITGRMDQARISRKAILAQIRSKEEIAERSATVRSQLWNILGGRPDETPLNARTTGKIERDGYRIEKVIFESMPQVYVTANLYVPKTGKPPYPGIIVPLGHAPNGKAYRNYQYSYQSLARKGYMVLAYDPFGQGERIQYFQPGTSRSRYPVVTSEHSQPGKPMILFGSGFARYLVWDGIRALDYLLSRSEVDPQRIGCTGSSGGGTMTMYVVALKPRIKVAVTVEGNFENLAGPYYDPPGAVDDAEQNIVGSLALGLDRGDLLASFAPKPLLMCYTVPDEGLTYSPVYQEATAEIYKELLRVYGILGVRDRVGLIAGHQPHGLEFFSRRAMYAWFNRWFGKTEAGVDEAEYDASPDAALNCTTTGQVLTSLGGRSVVQLNSDFAKRLLPLSSFSAESADLSVARERVCTQVAKLLALPSERTALRSQTLSSDIRMKLRMEEIQFESEPGVRVTGWFSRLEAGAAARPCVLYISDGLADEVVAEPSPFDEIFNTGYAVCAINLRGMGLSVPRPPRGGPDYYNGMLLEDRFAWANLVLGISVIGQRVWDILRTSDYLASRSDVDLSQVQIVGKGPAGLAALMAAALDRRVRSVLIDRTLATHTSIVDSQEYSLPLDWFLPGILQHFDLPDIVAAIHPRPTWVLNAVDAIEGVLPESAVH